MSVSSTDFGPPHPSGASTRAQQRTRWWMRLLVAGPVLLLAGFAIVGTALPAIRVRQLSLLDEAAHIDSVFKVPSVDRSGEKFLPETLDEVSCRGGITQWPDWE